MEEVNNFKIDVKIEKQIQNKTIKAPKTLKIYEYGDKYKGRYKDTHHKIYLRKKSIIDRR